MNIHSNPHKITPWYKEAWMLLIIGLPVVSIIMGIFILIIAIQGSDDLLSDRYYRQGMMYQENEDYLQRARLLQIQATISLQASKVTVTLLNHKEPYPKDLMLTFIHPTLKSKDIQVLMNHQAENKYTAFMNSQHLGHRKLSLFGPDWLIEGDLSMNEFSVIQLNYQ